MVNSVAQQRGLRNENQPFINAHSNGSPSQEHRYKRKDSNLKDNNNTATGSSETTRDQIKLALLLLSLVATQMVMLIATKQVMSVAPLPLLLCQAQYIVSCTSAALLLWLWKKCCRDKTKVSIPDTTMDNNNNNTRRPSSSWVFYLPLSICWTLGFVLFNASTAYMSPSHVNLMRCAEPVATVLVGFVVFQKRYSWRVLITLIPVLGGVWLASPSSGALSVQGILLAGLSNICFCMRPFVLQKMKQQPKGASQKVPHHDTTVTAGKATTIPTIPTTKEQDDLDTFLRMTVMGAVGIMPPLVCIMEGSLLRDYYGSLYSKLDRHFLSQILGSCFGFFFYQYAQICVMSCISPLAFSILTPVIKAVMIVLCSLYFGDAFSIIQALGVATTAGGGYWFTQTKNAGGTGPCKQEVMPQSSVLPVVHNPRHVHAA